LILFAIGSEENREREQAEEGVKEIYRGIRIHLTESERLWHSYAIFDGKYSEIRKQTGDYMVIYFLEREGKRWKHKNIEAGARIDR
jgi:hypothetical protein